MTVWPPRTGGRRALRGPWELRAAHRRHGVRRAVGLRLRLPLRRGGDRDAIDHGIEQGLNSLVFERASTEERHCSARHDSTPHSSINVVRADLRDFFRQVEISELVIEIRELLNHCLPCRDSLVKQMVPLLYLFNVDCVAHLILTVVNVDHLRQIDESLQV